MDSPIRTVASKVRQFGISLTQLGWTTTLFWAAFGALKPNKFVLLARDLPVDAIHLPRQDGVSFEQWTAAMMRAWRDQRHGLSPDFFRDAIDGVDTCAVAMVGNALAGMIWMYRREHPSRLFRLGAREVELNYGYILPEFRHLGLFSAVLSFACRLLQTHGYRRVYAGVHAGNGPSLRAFHNAAFQDIGTIRHYLVFRPKVRGDQLPCELAEHTHN